MEKTKIMWYKKCPGISKHDNVFTIKNSTAHNISALLMGGKTTPLSIHPPK